MSGPFPWPEKGEHLLEPVLKGEDFIYGFEQWVPDELDRLGYFAIQYHHCARMLVQHKKGLQAESIAYAVGFLYRHAIELYLKDIIARSIWYRTLPTDQQKAPLEGHSLEKLWNTAKASIRDYVEDDDFTAVEEQLAELHGLDKKSDGFRYPFGLQKKTGQREFLLQDFSNSSFDNFVFVLDGICNWLATTADMEDQYLNYLAEMKDATG